MINKEIININYIIVLPDENLTDNSLFQGISNNLIAIEWALRAIVDLPTDILDFGLDKNIRINRRKSGHGYSWMPLQIKFLSQITVKEDDPFYVVFSENLAASTQTAGWVQSQLYPPLHISTCDEINSVALDLFKTEDVRNYITETLNALRRKGAEKTNDALKAAVEAWKEIEVTPVNFSAKKHLVAIPNILTLRSLGAVFRSEETLHPIDDSMYVNAICESAREMIEWRDSAGRPSIHYAEPPTPDRLIVAPAMFSGIRQDRKRFPIDAPKGIEGAMRMLQRQRGYYHKPEKKHALELATNPATQMIMKLRTEELSLQTSVFTLWAASNMAATLRIPNGINHVNLSQLAGHLRTGPVHKIKKKAVRIFDAVQKSLAENVDEKLIKIIATSTSGVKIVSDAPLEWLPVGELPLNLVAYTSRIPATPGNLMIGQLKGKKRLYLDSSSFAEILLVSSFSESDPLSGMATHALEQFSKISDGKLKVITAKANSCEEFVQIVNDFQGAMMIFDGHGHHSTSTGVGALRIGNVDVDIWALKDRLRPPPIVILSACDTHAPDKTHATVGAGFLACGAQSVLGTLLNISGVHGAVFAGRLALRASVYADIVGGQGRAMLWSQVIGDMIRLDFLYHLITELSNLQKLDGSVEYELRKKVNMYIHLNDREWWSKSLTDLEQTAVCEIVEIKKIVKKVLAESDCIRYVSLGNPELICLTTAAIVSSSNTSIY